MKTLLLPCLLLSLGRLLLSCHAQTTGSATQREAPPERRAIGVVGGGCDGCELMYIGMPGTLTAVDTSAGWHEEKGQKLLITGKVFKRDGQTPAPNVVLYYWQTDPSGNYAVKPGLDARVRAHGYLRGWVKTDDQGRYSIYTIRPGQYPTRDSPAHVHLSVKEPDLETEYYLDDFVFEEDPLLTSKKRQEMDNRGGSGILRVVVSRDLQIAKRDLVLGLHIPNYPMQRAPASPSGRD